MTKYLSKKIKVISLFAIFAVIMIHSYNYKDTFLLANTKISEGKNICAMLEYFISNGIARFAVPLFFIISGYLFFHNFNMSLKNYTTKLKTRIRTLFIPYLIWTAISILTILFCYYILDAGDLPTVKNNIDRIMSKDLSVIISPPAFQLWYMLQLIIFSIASPLIFFLIKKTKVFIIIILSVFWIFDLNLTFIINVEGLLFYSIGAYIAIFSYESSILKIRSKKSVVICGLIFVATFAVKTYIAAIANEDEIFELILLIMHKAAIPFGIYFIWFGFDYIIKDIENKKQLLKFTNSTFMFYAMHEPLLNLSYEQIVAASSNNFLHLFMYITLPTCAIAVAYIFDIYTSKLISPLNKILTGNR